MQGFRREDFGENFVWGTSVSAYQIEGGAAADGKGPSVWDTFCTRRGKISRGETGKTAADFYNRWPHDLALLHQLGIPNFRFSLAWSRILPNGRGTPNGKGLDFYDRLIDRQLALGITPWVTLYHWDHPQALEDKGGWTKRDMVHWFEEYASICAHRYGDRVGKWMVLNEPLAFTGAGHFLGIHAPGRRWLNNFLPAVHHAALCQAAGGRLLRSICPRARIGTTFSANWIDPYRQGHAQDLAAATRAHALLNRLFLEPSLGLGYPMAELPFLNRMERWMAPEDESQLAFDFDFVGLQLYTRELVRHSFWVPLLQARLVSAKKRGVHFTDMGWEVYPRAIYHMLQEYSRYPGIRSIIITENGAAFPDKLESGRVHDPDRQLYLQQHLAQVLEARKQGAPVEGYFVWSFLDNFEWAEGYRPRFGLVHVDYASQERTIKDSGFWYSQFLKDETPTMNVPKKQGKKSA